MDIRTTLQPMSLSGGSDGLTDPYATIDNTLSVAMVIVFKANHIVFERRYYGKFLWYKGVGQIPGIP